MGKRTDSGHSIVKPYLKYVGGKSRLLSQLLPHLPAARRLIEPFVGSCAVSLAAASLYDRLLLSDVCQPLVSCHMHVQHNPNRIIAYLDRLYENHSEDFYYQVRANFNSRDDDWRKAAQFIYLNRHGFNGLTRFNRDGEYNVPSGHYTKQPYLPRDELLLFHKTLRRVEFCCASFTEVMAKAGRGDVVYCDPPYVPYQDRSDVKYAGGDFTQDDQINLARCAERAASRGAVVLISNHHTKFTRKIYRSADVHHTFEVGRSVSRSVESRTVVKEMLAIWRP